MGLNLTHLKIIKGSIIYNNSPNPLIKMPMLEIFETHTKKAFEHYTYKKLFNENFRQIIDFSSFKNLKYFAGELMDFLRLGNIPLEKASIYINDKNVNKENEKKMIKKIFELNALKEVRFIINKISDDEIGEIEGNNNNVNKIIINLEETDAILYNLQKKFPNLKDLTIIAKDEAYNKNIDIKENKNSKINKISIYGNKNVKFYCAPLEDLVKFELKTSNNMEFKDIFPIFDNNFNKIFKSLKYFKFKCDFCRELDLNIMKNIFNNLDKMPNLENFQLTCCLKFNETFANKLYQKLNSMDLDYFKVDINYEDNINKKRPISTSISHFGFSLVSMNEKRLINGIDIDDKSCKIRIYKIYNYDNCDDD